MLQVRNLPDEVHARLKERAAAEHLSLSDYVARELTELVRYRSNAEIFAAARARNEERGLRPGSVDEIVRAVREAREEREEQLWESVSGDAAEADGRSQG